jgi:hypothetical protein
MKTPVRTGSPIRGSGMPTKTAKCIGMTTTRHTPMGIHMRMDIRMTTVTHTTMRTIMNMDKTIHTTHTTH